MKFFFNKKENGHAVAEEIVMVEEKLDVAQKTIEDDKIAVVIGLALNMHLSHLREYEKAVITFQKILKPYSPWSSKIYGLRQIPNYTPTIRRK